MTNPKILSLLERLARVVVVLAPNREYRKYLEQILVDIDDLKRNQTGRPECDV